MNGNKLAELVDQRFQIIENLVELTSRQSEAISRGHMSDLMSILAAKQSPVAKLADLSKQLGTAIADDPDDRRWPTADARTRCREKHDRCESLILALLESEKECETQLSSQHVRLQEELDKAQGTGRAIESYASVSAGYQAGQPASPSQVGGSGDRLDLSSQ